MNSSKVLDSETHKPCLISRKKDIDANVLGENIAAQVRMYKKEIFRHLEESDHELLKFWLRKSKQLVLSILAVQVEGEEMKYFRGMNLEVSLPAGSLCAERNAIGTAVASMPFLKRKEFMGIGTVIINLADIELSSPSGGDLASLSSSGMDSEGQDDLGHEDDNPIWPCGVCSEWISKITSKIDKKIVVVAFETSNCMNFVIKYM